MNLQEVTQNIILGKLAESDDVGLLSYREFIEKLLDLTAPRSNNLEYDYEIHDDHIELQCNDGPSGSDMQAISGLEGWCKRFAKQIPDYNEIFYDELDSDWYSGMTFSNSGYRTVQKFWFNIYVDNNEKLANTFSKYNVQDLDNQIKNKQNKYNDSQIEKAKLYLTEIGFTEEQVNFLINLIIKNNLFSQVRELKRLEKSDIYKDIPLNILSKELTKNEEIFFISYIIDAINTLIYNIKNNQEKEINNNLFKDIKENNPEIIKWSKSILNNSGLFNDKDTIIEILKALNNGYSKEDIETVLNYYSERKEYSQKSTWIRHKLIRAMSGKYNLDKSKIQYLIDLCKDWSNIKYPQSLDEIVIGLEKGLTSKDIDSILTKYETTKDIRREINYLLRSRK